KQHWDAYITVANEAKNLELEFEEHASLEMANLAIDELITSEKKFKAWSEWLSAKETIHAYRLDRLTQGLEAHTILPSDAVDQVLTAFCRWIAPQLIDENEELRQFKTSSHEQ